MADKNVRAKEVYSLIKDALNSIKFKYETHDSDLAITLISTGDDLPMPIQINVFAERCVVRFISPMIGNVPEDKRVEGAIAVSAANYGIINGSFDYDMRDGEIRYRLAMNYEHATLTPAAIVEMLRNVMWTTDHYNDRFYDLSKGRITLEEFIKMDN